MSKYARRPSASIPDGDADTKMVRIKVTSIGDGGVGKSCLIKRYCEEKFVPRYISTIGVDFGVKPVVIDGLEIKVNFWDFSGHPEFFEVRNEFYKDTQGALLVFDVSSRASFESLDGWLQEAKRYGCVPAQSIRVKGGENTEGGNRRGSGRAGEAVMFLVGNKNDRERAVKTQEGRAFAAANGMKYFETSACSGENVTSVFEELFDDVSEHLGYRSGSSGNARSGISSAPEE